MTRVDLNKFIFVGAEEQKRSFFTEAQDLGLIHFVNISGQAKRSLPEEIQKLIDAIKVLRGLPVVNQEEPDDFARAHELADEILSSRREIDHLEEEQRKLKLEIARIQPFGEFSLKDLNELSEESRRVFQFYTAKAGRFDEEEMPEDLIYISSDHGLEYYLGIHTERKQYEKLVEMQFEHSLQELREMNEAALKRKEQLEKELKPLQKYSTFLHHALVHYLNFYRLDMSEGFTKECLDGTLFSIYGWVPANQLEKVKSLAAELGIYMEQIAVEEGDSPPTCLQNQGLSRVGEDLVHIYDTPSHEDKDPSLWVFSAFTLFFAMIVNDMGYGLIYLSILTFIYFKFRPFQGMGKRIMKLGFILSSACVIWGLFMTQFFGIDVAPNNPLKKVSFLNWLADKKVSYHLATQDATYQDWVQKYPAISTANTSEELMQQAEVKRGDEVANPVMDVVVRAIFMELALIIGVIHIILSMLRYLTRNWASVGWILVMIGAFLYFPHYLNTVTVLNYVFGVPGTFGVQEGQQLIVTGLVLAVVLAVFQYRLLGLAEVTVSIQILADVLSYLRLFALGLASGIVSQTINSIYGAVPLLVAVLIMVLAHGVNLSLGIMSGVIHGLRLNFLEWYHYSFEGGGVPYDPLRYYDVE